ncbi:hypothetical protein GGF46_002706 [Coemansia sp. RSA 552]|nr:hypothetical protein GGF46_002706 [Coemansia sp. RSA 552]
MAQTPTRIGDSGRVSRAVKAMAACVETRSTATAWQAYRDLMDLERVLGRGVVRGELHRQLPAGLIHKILRALMPDAAQPLAEAKEAEPAARHVYMYTKILGYLLLVSRSRTSERNRVAVLRLSMGRCIRRLVDPQHARTAEDAEQLVRLWREISESSPQPLQLTEFDAYLLILGAWKSGRHQLVPELYRMACQLRRWSTARFRKMSALVLSFYICEYPKGTGDPVIHSLLQDLERRRVCLSPEHYSVLILHFGRARDLDEALSIFERAMKDPKARNTEAVYASLFRGFGAAFQEPRRSDIAAEPEPSSDAYALHDAEDFDYIDGIDAGIWQDNATYATVPEQDQVGGSGSAERLDAAKVCMRIFQQMTSSNISVGLRTYRELMVCMVRFGLPDKAQQVFEFALDSVEHRKIPAGFIRSYLRLVARTPHESQIVLRKLMAQNANVAATMERLSKRELIDQYGIFNGDLAAFARREKRPKVAGRGGRFLAQYLVQMHKASRGADFIECMLAGNDPSGKFKGYNFPKLHGYGSGLASVEAELKETCQWMHELKPHWLRHRDVIYNLLPALPGIVNDGGSEPSSVKFIRALVSECRDAQEFVTRLDEARIEGFDIEMINCFLRVKFLGLTFQRYAKEKAARGRRVQPHAADKNLFWPTFMFDQASGPVPIDDDSPLLSMTRSAYSRAILRLVPNAATSWRYLVGALRGGHSSGLSPNVNTIGIMSRIAIYSEDWEFGWRIWSDVLRTASMGTGTGTGQVRLRIPNPKLPLQHVRIYKHYVHFVSQAPRMRSGAGRRTPALTEDLVVGMFELMERSGVEVTSGLLCQTIGAAFRAGRIDVGEALIQWQQHREQHGLARPDFLQQYFGVLGLPEPPAELESVLGPVYGAPAGCPRLIRLIRQRIGLRDPTHTRV